MEAGEGFGVAAAGGEDSELLRTLRGRAEAMVDEVDEDELAQPAAGLVERLLQSPQFAELRDGLVRDARAAAAAAEAEEHSDAAAEEAADDMRRRRERMRQAVAPDGVVGQTLDQLGSQQQQQQPPGGGKGALAEWWDGGEDGVLDLDALDADSQGSLPPYEQLAALAEQLHPGSASEEERRAAHQALQQYREHGLMGCPDWPAVCSGCPPTASRLAPTRTHSAVLGPAGCSRLWPTPSPPSPRAPSSGTRISSPWPPATTRTRRSHNAPTSCAI